MSAGAAVTSSGATSGKRLSSVLRCFWKSTDAMMDRYASDSCQRRDHQSSNQLKKNQLLSDDGGCLAFLQKQANLQSVFVPVVVLKDESDGGDVSRAQHRSQAAQRDAEVLLHAEKKHTPENESKLAHRM